MPISKQSKGCLEAGLQGNISENRCGAPEILVNLQGFQKSTAVFKINSGFQNQLRFPKSTAVFKNGTGTYGENEN